jgi:tryptophanyl-tRNA synthetase
MSTNYHNTIPIFADSGIIRKQVMRIVTDSKHPDEPKNPDRCNVFAIWRHFAPVDAVDSKRRLYRRGGLAYSDMKQELCELLLAKFDAGYQVYKNYLTDTSAIDRILKRAQKKREPLPGPRSPRFVVKLELSKS